MKREQLTREIRKQSPFHRFVDFTGHSMEQLQMLYDSIQMDTQIKPTLNNMHFKTNLIQARKLGVVMKRSNSDNKFVLESKLAPFCINNGAEQYTIALRSLRGKNSVETCLKQVRNTLLQMKTEEERMKEVIAN